MGGFRRRGDCETGRLGDGETWRLGYLEMGRLGDEENGKADFKRFFRNTNLRSLKNYFTRLSP